MTESRVHIRPSIAAIAPYRQGKPAAPDAFKLSSNENPFPPHPAIAAALAIDDPNRYPDATSAPVRSALAERWGVTPDEIHVGAGSVSIITQLIQATCEPGDEVIYAWRSFEGYPLLVATGGASAVPVPLLADFNHDLAAMLAAVTDRTRLVLVCSPNNPTGNVVTAGEFEEFMAQVPETVLVVLDEAYAEFVTDADAVVGEDLVNRYGNLVILRTFSKAFGLAGLRVGYAVGPERVLDALRVTAIPLAATAAAQRAALAAIEHRDELLERVDTLIERRERVLAGLAAAGLTDVPASQGNFVWIPTGEYTDAAMEVLAGHGIIARALGDGVRVSIGEEESVAPLVAAAGDIVAILNDSMPVTG